MNDDTKSVTWKATLIGGAMTIATSIAGYVSTHWGGVTIEQLKGAEDRIGAKVDGVKGDVAKSSDELKKYVDEKVIAAEERLAKAKVVTKRKVHVDQ